MPDERDVAARIAEAVERTRRVQEAARRVGREIDVERAADEAAEDRQEPRRSGDTLP